MDVTSMYDWCLRFSHALYAWYVNSVTLGSL